MKKISNFLLIVILSFGSHISINAQTCHSGILDPRIKEFLKIIGNTDQSLEELRKIPATEVRKVGPPYKPYPQADVQRIKVTADSIPVLVFNPSHSKNLPVLIYYHGGGFTLPLLPWMEYDMWNNAQTFGVIIFAVDYRVAPEHKFPAAVNDAFSAYKWISEHGKEYGGDTSRIILMGHSAGANLTAVVSQKARKEGISHKIKLQVMDGLPGDVSPKNLATSLSYQENAKGYMQTKAQCLHSIEKYLSANDYKNPEVSPILSKNLSGLPPAVIINAEFDPLRDDGIAYAKKLRLFGVKVWEKCFSGQIHCLIGLPGDSNEMKDYYALINKAIKATTLK